MERFGTKHYEIISRKGISKDIIEKCSSAYKINRKFFGKDCDFFRIYIANNEVEFKKRAGRFYKPWVKGVGLKGKRIVIREPALLKRNYQQKNKSKL